MYTLPADCLTCLPRPMIKSKGPGVKSSGNKFLAPWGMDVVEVDVIGTWGERVEVDVILILFVIEIL